jgi:hypothetical protein
MADTVRLSSISSNILLKISSIDDQYVCESCLDRETYLKEVLDELSSALTII